VDIREALRRYNVTPKKSLGQNFLFEPALLERIVKAGDVGPEDTVLEIGPGAGSLTRALAGAAARVVAVELDNRLLPVLEHTVGDLANVEVVHGDILAINLQPLLGDSRYKVVANIPYYITSALLRRLLEAPHPPALVVLTVQREVAARICARPPEMSLLAVSVQFYGRPRILGRIPAGAFYPAPDVDSAIVRIDLDAPPLVGPRADGFFELVKAGFSQKRKQLKNTLGAGLTLSAGQAERLLSAAGVDPARRAETLTIEEWLRLWRARADG
jgi:16S rRNA (adenine1518-N6/adenine1519-N6)-dimethyltransferase